MVEGGEAPVREIETLSSGVKTLERIMLSLRTSRGVDKGELAHLACDERREALSRFFDMLEDNGYCLPDERHLVLSPKGFFRSNTIIAELWERLGMVF
jgi:coproporphyrinogen III oxidase-like Fe-S oxidoreductase